MFNITTCTKCSKADDDNPIMILLEEGVMIMKDGRGWSNEYDNWVDPVISDIFYPEKNASYLEIEGSEFPILLTNVMHAEISQRKLVKVRRTTSVQILD